MTKQRNRRQSKNKAFKAYVTREREVIREAISYALGPFPNHRHTVKVIEGNFIENAGDFKLYNMADLNKLLDKAGRVYGEDAKRKAQEILAEVARHGNHKRLAAPPSLESLSSLREQFPNFKQAIDQIECATALSNLASTPCFNLPPLLLLGPPGVGKTAFCQAFASLVNVPFKRIDIGTISMPAMISSLSLGWATGHIGEVFELLTSASVGNPILMLDEVDKLNQQYGKSMETVLLALLERESSKTFKDEAILLEINASMINYIATANDLDQMSEPLRSRFTVIEIDVPSQDESLSVVQYIYQNLLKTHAWGKQFNSELKNEVIEKLVQHPPRLIKNLLQQACGRAALSGRAELKVEDVPHLEKELVKRKIGFL